VHGNTLTSRCSPGPPAATSISTFILDIISQRRWAKDARTPLFVLDTDRAREVKHSSSMTHVNVHELGPHEAHLNLASVLIELSRGGLQREHERRRTEILETTNKGWEEKIGKRLQIVSEIVISAWSHLTAPQ
jgi:hypothetical protein